MHRVTGHPENRIESVVGCWHAALSICQSPPVPLKLGQLEARSWTHHANGFASVSCHNSMHAIGIHIRPPPATHERVHLYH